MFKFYDAAIDRDRLSLRIRRILVGRSAMHRGELAVRTDVDESTLQSELEAMMARGEVERMRPLGYQQPDRDFFRLTGLDNRTVKAERYIAKFTSDEEKHIRLAGEAIACLAD